MIETTTFNLVLRSKSESAALPLFTHLRSNNPFRTLLMVLKPMVAKTS